MKDQKIWMLLIISILCSGFLWADYRETYSELFFGRHPSSRAEAMGRGYVTIDGDMDAFFYNPAGICNINFRNIKFTTASPYYGIDKARYYQFGLGYNFNNNIVIGLNINNMSYGEEYQVLNGQLTPYLLNYTLTLATPLSNNLLFGTNINYFIERYSLNTNKTMFFDVGSIYKHKLSTSFAAENELSFGASITNFSSSKITYDSSDMYLPVISRFGFSFYTSPKLAELMPDMKTLEILGQVEYQYLFNYDYRDGLHLGLETKFFEMFALRFGYYYENIDDGGYVENEDQLSDFTYGFGIDFPVYKFTNIPIHLQIDYTSLKQVSYVANYDDWENFNSFSFKLAWIK
jgi:hypothetical protein